ncbi:MAG TPA: hypothetical protein DCW90_15715 [Lachnospiraceae bacterium]|nr:class I SAM-dependent methyltransferase [uncultured Lachnoclostridium sp.]HAU86877.1 hypothetical protein [Lachnospiraceae bacterium]
MNINWEVNYPKGLIKYIDFFRKKYFQYDIFDNIVGQYIKEHSQFEPKTICSLGSGTGRHEVELAKLGYRVIGLERNEESVGIAKAYIEEQNSNVEIVKCDFLKKDELDTVMKQIGEVDAVVLLFIPISIESYAKAVKNMSKWLKKGGVFVADNFAYEEGFDDSNLVIESNVEVVDSPDKSGYAVRFNYYEYKDLIVNWDAVYLYYDEDQKLTMKRDHDILDIIPVENEDPLKLDKKEFEILENRVVTECNQCIAPPHMFEYLMGRRKL